MMSHSFQEQLLHYCFDGKKFSSVKAKEKQILSTFHRSLTFNGYGRTDFPLTNLLDAACCTHVFIFLFNEFVTLSNMR